MAFRNIVKSILLICTVVLAFNTSFANGGKEEDKSAFIMHHIKDAHEWHIMGETSVYLPVILFDGGMKVFSSKSLYDGEVKTATNKEGELLDFDYVANTELGYGMFLVLMKLSKGLTVNNFLIISFFALSSVPTMALLYTDATFV